MEILQYLDVAIGFTLGMMVLATLIGTTSAMWLAAIRSRIRDLENGLQQTLTVLGNTLSDVERLEVVKSILRDRLMTGWAPVRWLGFGATDAIGREEFVLMLLRRAGGPGAWGKLETAIKAITNQDPRETLRAVEAAILTEEAANPNLPSHIWRTRALAQEAPALASRLFAQFDDVLTRAEDNTAYSSKVVSVLLTAVFLIVYPVSSFDIISRLMNNGAIAKSLADLAAKTTDSKELTEAVNRQGLFGDVFQPDSAHRKMLDETCHGDPWCIAKTATAKAITDPGIWTTLFLVSLGAPFWDSLLNKLLGLRSKITERTETERHQRAN